METAVELIGSLGVPVAFCLMLGWFVYQIWRAQRDDNNRREVADRETITHLSSILSENSKALLKNSEVMSSISQRLENIDDKIDDIQKDVTEIKIRQNNKEE